jgi:hypothetical protein
MTLPALYAIAIADGLRSDRSLDRADQRRVRICQQRPELYFVVAAPVARQDCTFLESPRKD